jgi:UDP-N-acetylmuramate--alanine ligase
VRVHFFGAGGKGIAPAASLALQAGYEVTGDDLTDNHRTRLLREAGAAIRIGANRLPEGHYSSVVATAALSGSRIIGGAGREAQPVLGRLEFVQQVFADRRKDVLAVCGTVGKSTAAAIVHAALGQSRPSCYIGADIDGLLCGARLGSGPWAITEACEYQDSYFGLRPRMLMLLNIAPNHEDHFGPGTLGFSRSIGRLIPDSADSLDHVILATGAAATLRDHGLMVHGHTVGFGDPDWQVMILDASPDRTRFSLTHQGLADTFDLPLAGTHAALAAAMAVVAARLVGLDDRAVQAGLDTARLPDRRMSVRHSSDHVVIYDDNARLPLQLESLLNALRQRHPQQRLIAVVSPWGRRNRRNLREWAPVAAKADFVYVLPVDDASTLRGGAEDPAAAADLAALIGHYGGAAQAISHVSEIVLAPAAGPLPDVYVTAGYDSNEGVFAEVHQRLAAQSS